MLKYLPASFVYTSRVSAEEQTELDRVYMPHVLKSKGQLSKSMHHVRTDYHDCTAQPWGLFNETMFGHFRNFAAAHLLCEGVFIVTFKTWFNYYPAGGSMSPHSHPDTDFGLVYCLRNAGQKKTHFHTYSHEYDSIHSRYPRIESCRFDWNPSPGEYIFFPGSLFHGTQACDVDGQRISLVANIWIKKVRGDAELSVTLDTS